MLQQHYFDRQKVLRAPAASIRLVSIGWIIAQDQCIIFSRYLNTS